MCWQCLDDDDDEGDAMRCDARSTPTCGKVRHRLPCLLSNTPLLAGHWVSGYLGISCVVWAGLGRLVCTYWVDFL